MGALLRERRASPIGAREDVLRWVLGVVSIAGFPAAGAAHLAGLTSEGAFVVVSLASIVGFAIATMEEK